MIKLREIISRLDENVFKNIENNFVKTKAENFLFLLKSYRGTTTDAEIIDALELNSNSFYVLKSRLYDRIQNHLSGDIHTNKEELLKKLQEVYRMCYTESREVATAFLEKLEKDLLYYDLHNELLVVYSALKKIHLYSDKYFYYSQLYNRHIAFGLSLEKSEETLGNFNRILMQYNFSRSSKLLDNLFFIRKEMANHYALNQSRQIEIIKNFIELQLLVFCDTELNKQINTEEVLQDTQRLMKELPDSSQYKHWQPALDYLFFEYYFKTGHLKQASSYYTNVNAGFQSLFLYTNICVTSRFLVSKIAFLQEMRRVDEIRNEDHLNFIVNTGDMHTKVLIGIYNAMRSYYGQNYKEAINKLNEILNENSFKDYFHINTDVKLTLAFVYLLIKEYDLAESTVKSIYRKIKSEKIETYPHVLDLIKAYELEIKQASNRVTQKHMDYYTLFSARNKSEYSLLLHLQDELKKKYN